MEGQIALLSCWGKKSLLTFGDGLCCLYWELKCVNMCITWIPLVVLNVRQFFGMCVCVHIDILLMLLSRLIPIISR